MSGLRSWTIIVALLLVACGPSSSGVGQPTSPARNDCVPAENLKRAPAVCAAAQQQITEGFRAATPSEGADPNREAAQVSFLNAVEHSTACIGLNPYGPAGYALRAQANFELGKASTVDADISTALSLNPNFDLAILMKAYRLLDQGKTQEAAQLHSRLEALGSPYSNALGVALMLISMDEASKDWDQSAQQWERVALIDEEKFKIDFGRQLAHPVQAEYHRRLTIIPADGAPEVVQLPMNTGGRTHINVFWIESVQDDGPWLRLLDHTGEYMLHPASRSLQRICHEDTKIIHVAADSCARSTSDGIVSYLGEATPPPKFYPGIYLGSIDGRSGPLVFRGAEEAPQEETRPPFRGY